MSAQNPGPPQIFDRKLIANHRQRRTHARTDFITQMVIDDLMERLAPIMRPFSKALIIGPDARLLPEKGVSASGVFTFERGATLVKADDFAVLDPENLHLPETDYDLIVSLLDIQFINDVPGFLSRINQHLAPDGLMLAAALGGATLSELRAAWLEADTSIKGGAFVRVAPFIDVRDAGGLLQRAGFALPVTDIEHHTVRYASPLSLMQELQNLGASNPLSERPRTFTTKTMLGAAMAAYQAGAGDEDGRVRATLEIVWMSGWAKHESQQKPLKPGSAQISLTKVLKPSTNT